MDQLYIDLFQRIEDNTFQTGLFAKESSDTLSALYKDVRTAMKEQKKEGKVVDLAAAKLTPLSILGITNGVSKFDKKAEMSGLRFISFMNNLNKSVIDKLNPEKTGEFSTVMGAIGGTIKTFAFNLAKSLPALIIAAPAAALAVGAASVFLGGMQKLMPHFKGNNMEKMTKGVDGLAHMGKSLAIFGGTLALATLAMIPVIANPLGVLTLFAMTVLAVGTFSLLSSRSKNLEQTSKAVGWMSLSMLAFAGSLALSSMIVQAVSVPGVLMTLGVLGLTAITFGLIGGSNDVINKGTLSVALMALGLAVFATSLAYSSEKVAGVGLQNMGILALALGGTALLFGLAGKFWVEISLGALAFAFVGLSLMLLSNPLKEISQTVTENEGILWKLPAMLLGIGGVYALAGIPAVAALIALGAGAFALIGGSLWVLGKGLQSVFSTPTIDEAKADGFKLGLKALVSGFAEAFDDISLKDALTLPLKIPVIGAMGLALIPLAFGIKSWMKVADSWTPESATSLTYTIASLSKAFATAGSTEGMSTLFGFNVGNNDVERGIESTEEMGDNLINLSEGILAWKNMKITTQDLDIISNNVSSVLNTIPSIFATIGQRDRLGMAPANQSLIGKIFGADLAKGDIEAGIDATRNLGGNLKDLADGIKAWSTGGKEAITPAMVEDVKANVSSLLATLPSIFADIGKKDKDSSGWFPWSEGDIEAGVELVSDMANPLKVLAESMKTLKDVENPQIIGHKFGMGVKALLAQVHIGLQTISDKDIDKLERIVKPLDKLSKVMKDMGIAMKDQATWVTKMDKTYVENFRLWATALYNISEVNTPQLERNIQQSRRVDFSRAPAPSTYTAPQEIDQAAANIKKKVGPGSSETELQMLAVMEAMLEQMTGIRGELATNRDELAQIKQKVLTGITVKTKEF